MRLLVDLRLPEVVALVVDVAALEAELLHAADLLEFGGHLLWSERQHHLPWMNRRSRSRDRSRDVKEEPWLVSERQTRAISLATLTHSFTRHGLGLIKGFKGRLDHGASNAQLAAHHRFISSKHGRIRCRSWFDIIHSAPHAASRGS